MRTATAVASLVLCLALVLAAGCVDNGEPDAKQLLLGSWKMVKRVDRGRERSIDPLIISFRPDGTATIVKTNKDTKDHLRWKWATYGGTEYVCMLRATKPDRIMDLFMVGFTDQGREMALTEVRHHLPFKSMNKVVYLARQ